VVGAGVSVGAEAEIDDSVLHPGAVIESGATVRGSIVGPRVRVGAGARVSGSALAEGAVVRPGSVVDGARVSAGQTAH
jgi:mannose-1-phosphate guanylyltransferase